MNVQLLQDVETIAVDIYTTGTTDSSSKAKLFKTMLKFSASVFEPQGYEALQDWECMHLLNKLDYYGKVTNLHSQSSNDSLLECYKECRAIAKEFEGMPKVEVKAVNDFIGGFSSNDKHAE